jgi:hypothetical protein
MPDPTDPVPHYEHLPTDVYAFDGLDTPTDVAGLIVQDATLAAIGDVVAARRTGLRMLAHRWLGHPGAKLESAAGTALVTDPKMRGTVVDPDAFLSWALRSQPDRTSTQVEIAEGPIVRALAGEFDVLDDRLSVRLAEILDEIPGAVTVVPIVDERLATDLGKPSVSREDADGRLWLKATGEEIPGLALRPASQPRPKITPDPDLVATVAGSIVDRLAPLPALDEEGPVDA